MVRDRPAMAKYGEKAAPLYEWAARKFAGEDLHEPFLWNSAEPLPDFPADNQSPTAGQPGSIRVLGKERTGPAQGKDRMFEELWHDAVFELYNIAGAKDFQRIEADAAAGKLSRDGFCEKILDVESRAAEKTRAFYICVFLPWAKEHGVPTQPRDWYVAWRSDPHENLVLGNIGKDDMSWRNYATWYDRIMLGTLAAKGKDDEARKLAAEMLKRAATKQEAAEIYGAKGSAYAEKGDFDKALADYSEAIKADPKCVLAWQCRGFIYSNRGDHAKALADLSEAVRLSPKDAVGRCYRATAYANKGDLEMGLSDVLEAMRITPALAGTIKAQWVYFCLQDARNCADKGEWDRASADCSQALRLDPKSASAYRKRAYVYLCQGDYAKALPDLNESIQLDPTTPAPTTRGPTSISAKGTMPRRCPIWTNPSASTPRSLLPTATGRRPTWVRAISTRQSLTFTRRRRSGRVWRARSSHILSPPVSNAAAPAPKSGSGSRRSLISVRPAGSAQQPVPTICRTRLAGRRPPPRQ